MADLHEDELCRSRPLRQEANSNRMLQLLDPLLDFERSDASLQTTVDSQYMVGYERRIRIFEQRRSGDNLRNSREINRMYGQIK